MLDWFRKKKTDTTEEGPETRIQAELDDPENPAALEAEIATDIDPGSSTEAQPAGAENVEAPGPQESLTAEEPLAAEEPGEQPTRAEAPKKGLFARLWASKEEPRAGADGEAASQDETTESTPPPEPAGQPAASPLELADVYEPEARPLNEEPSSTENDAAVGIDLPSGKDLTLETPAMELAAEVFTTDQATTEVDVVDVAPPVEEDLVDEELAVAEQTEEPHDESQAAEPEGPRKGLLARFREKLSATRSRLAGRLEVLLSSVRSLDDDLLDELEELLITSDLGAKTTGDLLFKIRGQVAKKELKDVRALKEALKKSIRDMVDLPRPALPQTTPLVIMVVGINGVGKTTTIAKLSRRLTEEGKKVLLAAGDTFRSAAVEQLSIWAERLGVDIVAQPTGSDPSAVVFDALSAARARGSDVVIIDTAGRLHTKVNLMDELKKIKRVASKALAGAPHHTILVLDGNTGQNAQRQAQTFHEAVGVDSIIITKLDGTAKGGVIVSIANELKIPITFVGLGESFEDLQPFDPEAFTEAILGQ